MNRHNNNDGFHPSSTAEMIIQSFQWWIASTLQQTKHVRVVGWEYPTIHHQKARNQTKRVGWEHPTTKDRKWN